VRASQRRATTLGLVEDSGAVRVSELVDQLGVSDMTVRRDIEQLASEGLVERVHGGALSMGRRSSEEPGFTVKSPLMQLQKSAIAQTAAQLVEPGAAIGISAGTTTYEFARAVRNVPDLTVVTNSVPVAQLLHESGTPGQTVVLTGGMRTPSDALVGPVAVAALRMLHVDRLFLGVHGMDARAGLTTPNLVEAETNRALIAAARRVLVVADHSKWGIVGLSTIATLDQVDVLVTDADLDATARRTVSQQVGQLVIAPATPTPAAPAPRAPGADAAHHAPRAA